MRDVKVPTLDELLEKSAATEEFKQGVRDVADNHRPNDRVAFGPGNPPIKVLRVISQLLESHPSLQIDRIDITGRSGCSDYRGVAIVNGSQNFRFVWDCAWKATKVGWIDFLGNPDQIRAARTYGYQCFEEFQQVS